MIFILKIEIIKHVFLFLTSKIALNFKNNNLLLFMVKLYVSFKPSLNSNLYILFL